ncbi:hypothetical protein, partial [Streptomyces sp. NPDC055140]
MPHTHTHMRPAPISAGGRTAIDHAHVAERMRAQLVDFWGKPVRGVPRGGDLMASMHLTATGRDLVEDPDAIALYFTMCANFANAYRDSDVWVAPCSMGDRIAQHPFVNTERISVVDLPDSAPARDGLVYFPTPIDLDGLHPVHGLAWHLTGTGNDVAIAIETITATHHVPTRLPPLIAASTKLPLGPYCPNSVTTLYEGVLCGYGNPHPFGAPDRANALRLVLAFWELRAPTTPDDPDSPDAATAPGEDIVKVPQHTAAGTQSPARGRKNKRTGKAPRSRRIRIIREPVHTPTEQERPATGPTRAASEPKWKDDTLRWKVGEKWQNRCPNPHQHRAIIEAGGECEPVRVRVKLNSNVPTGRSVDPRRT